MEEETGERGHRASKRRPRPRGTTRALGSRPVQPSPPQHRTQDSASAGLTTPGEAAETWVGTHVPGARFQQWSFCSFLSPRGHRRLVFPGSKEPPPWDGWGSRDLPALGAKSRLCVPQDVELCFSLKAPGKDGPSLPLSPSTEEICSKDTNNVKERIQRADHMNNLVYRFLSAISN